MKTRVDVLVRVRSLERDGKALALARAEAELRQAEDEALALEQAITAAHIARDEAQAAGEGIAVIALYDPYIEARQRALARALIEIDALKEEAERRRSSLRETAKELDTYERYRERLIEERRGELRAIELRELDEHALRRRTPAHG